jgi:hypothetical protein
VSAPAKRLYPLDALRERDPGQLRAREDVHVRLDRGGVVEPSRGGRKRTSGRVPAVERELAGRAAPDRLRGAAVARHVHRPRFACEELEPFGLDQRGDDERAPGLVTQLDCTEPAVTTRQVATSWCMLGAFLERPDLRSRAMACTQLRRSRSPLGGAGSGTKHVRPHGRGRFEAWRGLERAAGKGLERRRKAQVGRLLLGGVVGMMLAIGTFAAAAGSASQMASTLEPESLARARAIRAQLDARYRVVRARGLAVTEATATGVIESFTLFTPDLLETRLVPADNGIYYAICPARASCPYPARRFARPAAELVPRRLALELALRTFLETSADVVAVSLPTPRFILFVVERTELAREVDLSALAKALDRDPSRALSSSLEVVVDRLTRARVYVALGLEPTPNGRDSLMAVPRWPTVGDKGKDSAPSTAAGSATRT